MGVDPGDDQLGDAPRTVSGVSDMLERRDAGGCSLVVGCGDGREAGQLARQLGVGVIGIDICADFDFTHEDSAPVTLLTMDAQTLQFDENSFDVVYSSAPSNTSSCRSRRRARCVAS